MGRRRCLGPQEIKETLGAAKAAFDSVGATWWIQDGTALGAVRHGGPIPGEYDIDIGMPATEFRWSLLDRFAEAGFGIDKIRGTQADNLKLRMLFRDVPLDLYLMYPHGLRWAYWMAHKGCSLAAVVTPFSVGRINFVGLELPCPEPAELYLKETYGPKWRVPEAAWHPAMSQPNLKPRGGVVEKARFRYRRAMWSARNAARAVRVVGRRLFSHQPGLPAP